MKYERVTAEELVKRTYSKHRSFDIKTIDNIELILDDKCSFTDPYELDITSKLQIPVTIYVDLLTNNSRKKRGILEKVYLCGKLISIRGDYKFVGGHLSKKSLGLFEWVFLADFHVKQIILFSGGLSVREINDLEGRLSLSKEEEK